MMLRWLRNVGSPSKERSRPDTVPKSQTRHVNVEALPSTNDRALMLRAVMLAADTVQTNKFGEEQRLRHVLQEELVPSACEALHLVDDKCDKDELLCVMARAAALDPSTLLEDPFACVSLLVSNIVLQYGSQGGYDARVRHVLKTACVHVLYERVNSDMDDQKGDEMDAFDETVGVIFFADTESLDSDVPTDNGGECNGTTDSSAFPQADNEEPHRKEDETSGTTESSALTQADTEEPNKEHNGKKDETNATTDILLADHASKLTERQSHVRYIVTRKFELIERSIAARIFRVLIQENESRKFTDGERTTMEKERKKAVRKQVIRGIQITSVGVVAGTLFAVTGGLAGPAIAAGIAGLGVVSSASAATAIAMLTTVKAAAALFGVGGGGLAAYKMKKRTQGLTEFHIRRENIEQNIYEGASDESIQRGIEASLPQLHTHICISGWLKDKSDYQRPWGIQPTDPPIADRVELLKRFFAVHDRELVGKCEEIIKQRRKRERKRFSWDVVWAELEEHYGRSPDHLLPLDSADTDEINLTNDEQESINDLLQKVVLMDRESTIPVAKNKQQNAQTTTASGSNDNANEGKPSTEDKKGQWSLLYGNADESEDVLLVSSSDEAEPESQGVEEVDPNIAEETGSATASLDSKEAGGEGESTTLAITETPEESENTLVVWDWQALYGGDLHTVTWESKALLGLCHVVNTMAAEVTSQATKIALQFSIIGALIAAVAIPSALLTASQLIDDPYQIVILRADEAGRELAKCLLQSEERRPVTLVGYSFGARVIYSCLMELARHQKLWEKKQGLTEETEEKGKDLVKWSKRDKSARDESDSFEYMREPASIVEDVVFMGLPRIIDRQALTTCREVTGGRMVNCYTRNDWFLSLMFIARAGTQTCGTSPIKDVSGIENFNVTELVKTHSHYPEAVPTILQLVDFGKPNVLSTEP